MPLNTPSQRSDSAGFSDLEQVAADWMIRRDRGLSADEETAFQAWLKGDPRHEGVFRDVATAWGLMEDYAETESGAKPGSKGGRWWLPVTLAAAAAVGFGFFAWVVPAKRSAPFAGTVATEVGGLKTMNLPDGSVATLNTATAVAVNYSASERRVRLTRGEAHFTVAKNPERPFIVEAKGVAVRAVGTAFDVRVHPEAVEVKVTEGRVRINNTANGSPLVARSGSSAVVSGAATSEIPDSAGLLVAGERVLVSTRTASSKVSEPTVTVVPAVVTVMGDAEVRQTLAWRERRLDFDSATLQEMVAEINRYNRHQLRIVDTELGSKVFGGSFPAGDFEVFVRVLESNFGVSAERRDNETLLQARGR